MTAHHTEEELDFVHGGVTVTTLAQIFGLDSKECNRRLVGKITPVQNAKYKTTRYRIRDAAPYLIESKINVEEYLKTLSPSKLPPALQDAFWKAQLSRQKYEEQRGDLWRTNRVIEVMAGAFKVAKLQIQMFVDNVQGRTELTDKQRDIIAKDSDSLMSGLESSLVSEFELYIAPPDEHGQPLSAHETLTLAPEEGDGLD